MEVSLRVPRSVHTFFTNIESHEKKAGLIGLNLTVQGGGQILRSTPLMGDGQ